MPIVSNPLPAAEALREMFIYDPETGVLSRPSEPGRQVGTLSNGGYWTVRSGCRKIRKAHRIIWKMMTGEDPVSLIDHANGDKSDNTWSNLREADNSLNMANRRKVQGDLKKGAHRVTRSKTWFAMIRVNGHCHYLGTFKTEEDAHAAYEVAAKKYFGEYARVA